MGHLKDILKEWRSAALYLPLLALHAGPTAIHPLYSWYCFLLLGALMSAGRVTAANRDLCTSLELNTVCV